jgi:hypothetical protein
MSMDASAAMTSESSFRLFSPITPSEFIGAVLIVFEAGIKIFPRLRRYSIISKLRILSDVIDRHQSKIARSKSFITNRSNHVVKNFKGSNESDRLAKKK